jgi:magnesium chelatase family protein
MPPTGPAMALLERALRDGAMSARGAERALRVAWTLCDLRGARTPNETDVAAALTFRDRRDR